MGGRLIRDFAYLLETNMLILRLYSTPWLPSELIIVVPVNFAIKQCDIKHVYEIKWAEKISNDRIFCQTRMYRATSFCNISFYYVVIEK
jgi:hypothetical protein